MNRDKKTYTVYIPFEVNAHSHQGAVAELLIDLTVALATSEHEHNLYINTEAIKVEEKDERINYM